MNLFYGVSLLLVLLHTSYSFYIFHQHHHQSNSNKVLKPINLNNNHNVKYNHLITLRCTETPNIIDEGASTDNKPPSLLSSESLSELIEIMEETAEEKYKREKLAEIAERKAEEVFVTRSTGTL